MQQTLSYLNLVWVRVREQVYVLLDYEQSSVSRHTIVCRAAQEAGAPHREYINRKKENAIFTPM